MKREAPPSSTQGLKSGPAKSRLWPIFLVLTDPKPFGSFTEAVKRVEESAREALGIEPISIGVSGPEHLHRLREAVVEARRRGMTLLVVIDEPSKLLLEVIKAADLTLETASLIRAKPARNGGAEFRVISSPAKLSEVPTSPSPQGPFRCPTCGLVAPDEIPRCPRCGSFSGSPPATLGASVLSSPDDLAAHHPFFGQVEVHADLERRLRVAFFGRATAFKIHTLGALAESLAKSKELKCLTSLRKVNPLTYQTEAARRALFEAGGRALLCDPTGAGKSFEVGLILSELKARKGASDFLIIAPGGLLNLWKEELHSKFGLDFRATDGRGTLRRGKWLLPLEALSNLSETAALHRWEAVVVDEAHRLEGRHSPAWRLLFGLKAKYLFLLTACPLRKGIGGFFDLLALLQPGLVGAPSEFMTQFALDDETLRVEALPELRELLSQVAVYTGGEVSFPSPEGKAIFVKSTEEELRSIKRAEEEVLRLLEAEKISADEAALLLAASSLHFPAKTQTLLDFLSRAKEPTVVYSADEKFLLPIAAELSKAGLRASVGAGGKRKEPQILLLSDEMAIQSPPCQAKKIVNLDLPPNPTLLVRRVERHLKPGAQGRVEVASLCVKGSFEERLFKVLVEGAELLELTAGGVEAVLHEMFGEKPIEGFIRCLLQEDAEALGRALLLAKGHLRQAEERSAETLRQVFGEGETWTRRG